MVLVQNQGKRTFIIPEGTVVPLGTVSLSDDRAKILCKEYEEFKVLEVIKADNKVVETVEEEPESVEVEEEPESVEVEESLEDKTRPALMQLCKEKGLKFSLTAKKEDLINLLKGE